MLVTGAEGFIGSHLIECLVGRGHSVRAMVQYNSFGTAGWLDASEVRDDIEIFPGDVRDSDSCSGAVSGIEIVIHLAALIAIPYSYEVPRSYLETNAMGTLNMCRAALAEGAEQFVQLSTSEVYGTARSVPISEDHPMQPQSPYAASKVAADAVATSFHRSFGLPLVIARPFNTYGPRQSRRAFIPAVMTQVLSGLSTIRTGDLSPTRDLTFVGDTALALSILAESGPHDGSVINIGTGIEYSMREVVEMIQVLTATSLPVREDVTRMRPSNSEVFRLIADNSKLRSTTGYSPNTSLSEGLLKTYDWLKSNPDVLGKNVDEFVK